MQIKIDKVDNGYVVSINKYDRLTGQPEVSVTVHPTLDSVIEKIKSV